jgi:TolB-like protein
MAAENPGKTLGLSWDYPGIILGILRDGKMQTEQNLGFGPYLLDLVKGQVRLGEQEVKLTPKALTVLHVLVTRAGQLVGKDDLFQTVWADTVVSDDALTTCILELRRALGDNAKQPRYIETMRRRGYRFIAPVTVPATETSSPSDKPSIAVLPFTNMSGDPEQEYFSDGLTDDLITDLSRISCLFVIARHSTFTYKGKAAKVQEVGTELGVRYVLEGSVRKMDGQVRINTQLVDAITGHHMWAGRYDRPLQDVFAVQDEIVRQVVATLQLRLTVMEQGACFKVRQSTTNLEAYDLLLRGVSAYMRFTQKTNLQARQLAKQALALDPQYAEAYALQAWTYWLEWSSLWSQDPQAIEQAFTLVQKARALDDSLPQVHELLGYIFFCKDQREQAIAAAERAIVLGPNDDSAYAVLGAILLNLGRAEEAIGLIEKAMHLNPHSPYGCFLGAAYAATGRHEEAITALNKALAVNPDLLLAHLSLASLYSELGRQDEAQTEATEILRVSPNFSLEGWRQRSWEKDQAALERHITALRKAGLK